ncbi:MAG: Ig-like domain-containing protein [Cytophagales bacterium]|nr:Ig-like domain-containing protein [Bernardetiaceae bacterium]MDW8204575.1 Ig-like domain-containing protein [Cytophagales bacterium]
MNLQYYLSPSKANLRSYTPTYAYFAFSISQNLSPIIVFTYIWEVANTLIMRSSYIGFAFLLIFPYLVAAQNGGSEKGFYIDGAGNYYHRLNLPVYIRIASSPDDAGVLLSGKKNNENQVQTIPIQLDGHGTHYLRHLDATDPQNTFFYIIHADGKAPQNKSVYITPNRFFDGKTHFYGKDLIVELQSNDDMSGVEKVFLAQDGGQENVYTASVAINQEGERQISYYAIDRVGNRSAVTTEKFVVDVTPPQTRLQVTGISETKVVSVSTRFYFFMEDNIVGVAKTLYKIDNDAWEIYKPGQMLPIEKLSEGEHTITFYSVDKVNNQEEEQTFSFFMDRTAPIMSADILGDKFIVGNQVYFSGRTKLKLTALDNKAGVKNVFYSIDNGEQKKYEEPFYMPEKPGLHIVRYFAEDNIGNAGVYLTDSKTKAFDEVRQNISAVYVDLTGPVIRSRYVGKTFQRARQTFTGQQTSVEITAVDTESGLQRIAYRFEDQSEEQPYSGLIPLTERIGKQRLELIAYDNVNNRNAVFIEFWIDGTRPQIAHRFSVAPIAENTYPTYAKLFLSVQDEDTSPQNIFYSINGAPPVPYQSPISGFKKNTAYEIRVFVEDVVGNRTEEIIRFQTADF